MMAGESQAPIAVDALPPERLGIYRLETCLGRGGMGEVYLAWDEILERHVAIKRVREDLSNARRRARFLREARAVARLDHPAIVRIYHVLERDDGDCLVMEYVRGHNLAQLAALGPLDPGRVAVLGRDLAEGLAAAHAQGLVHRDLKPANVIDAAGCAKILDFGLAKALWSDEDECSGDEVLTQSGMVVGTVCAMSPEQAIGGPVDHRSDLFALGSLLYELLAGRAPFRGASVADSLRRVVSVEPEPIEELVPKVPEELARLVGALLTKTPERRPASARRVAVRLAEIAETLAGTPAKAPAGTPAETSPAALSQDTVLPTASWAALGDTEVHPRVTAKGVPSPGWSPAASRDPAAALRALVRVEAASGGPGEAAAVTRVARRLAAAADAFEVAGSGASAVELVFERPAEAVAFALALHRALALEPDAAAARVGVARGQVVVQPRAGGAAEVEGRGLEVVRLLARRAGGRQTLLDRTAFDIARGARAPAALTAPEVRWLALGAFAVDELDAPLEICEVGIDGVAPLAPPAAGALLRRPTGSEENAPLWRPATGQPVPRRANWRLVERLGEGGFGEVWLARHKSGEERVFKLCFEPERLRALKREVTLFRLLRESLGHRRDIARVLDWDFDEVPYFLELEYTEAGDLVRWAERCGGLETVPLATRLELVAQVAEALGAAHSVGVLHKDVKPRNVLVDHDADGRPQALLTDFGIGRLTDREVLRQPGFTVLGFTETMLDDGSRAGTVQYMAPELLKGQPATVQADVFSLGVLLYQMAVGDFDRALAAGWRRDIDDPLLEDDVASCVDGAPERRLHSALELAERLRALEERRRRRRADEEAAAARSRARRRRRLAGWLAAGAAILLLVVSVFAFQTYRAQNREREARQIAEQRRRQAEDLIDFLLGDLRQELQPIGKLAILDKVGDRAMAYFAAVPEGELSRDEMASYAKALHQIGQVRFALGKVPEATEAFGRSLAMAKSLAALEPENPERQFELGQSHFWLGFLRWRERDLDAALEQFEAYARISQALVERAPDNLDWRLELAYSYSNLGSIHEERGDLERATRDLETSAQIFQRLVDRQPTATHLPVELAHVQAKLGQVLRRQVKLAESLARFRSALGLYQEALAIDAKNPTLLQMVGATQGHIGNLLRARGDVAAAHRYFLADLEASERLAELDPENLEWKEYLSLRLNKVGHSYLAAGDLEKARERFVSDQQIVEDLNSREKARSAWHFAWARNRCSWAVFYLRLSMPRSALQPAEECRATFSELVETSPERWYRWWLAQAYLLLGEIHQTAGEDSLASESWREGARIIRPLIERDPLPVDIDLWVRLLILGGRRVEAEPWIAKLTARGYGEAAFVDFLEAQDDTAGR